MAMRVWTAPELVVHGTLSEITHSTGYFTDDVGIGNGVGNNSGSCPGDTPMDLGPPSNLCYCPTTGATTPKINGQCPPG